MKFKYQKVPGTDFYDASNFNSLLTRLDSIQPTSVRQWGSMNVAQMLHHLNISIGCGLGYYQLKDKSHFAGRTIIRFIVLNVLQRFPVRTEAPSTLKVTESYDFDTEKNLLREILTKAFATKTNSEWSRHTYFGRMSRKDWGKLIMIHCHHHFQQFSN